MRERGLKKWLISIAIVLVCFFFAFPVLWLILTALRPASEVFYVHVGTRLTLANFFEASKWPNLGSAFLNSGFVATVATAFSLAITLPSGYMLARYKGWLSNTWFFTIYVVRSVPFITWLLPLYLVIQRYGLYDTYTGIIATQAAFHITFFSWVLKGFFEGVPTESEEAAYIDGCSRWRAFIQIVLPQAVPGIIAVGILGWLWGWNEFLFALILTSSGIPMLTVTMVQFIHEMGVEWNLLAATAVMAIVPGILFTLFTQRYLVKGLGGLTAK